MSKLTLHVPDELIEEAKSIAAKRKVSVSKMVSDYFRHLATTNKSTEGELAPRTSSLAGCIKDVDTEDYIDYLEKKHS